MLLGQVEEGTIVRLKKTKEFAIIRRRVYMKDNKSFLHYECEIEGRGGGHYATYDSFFDVGLIDPVCDYIAKTFGSLIVSSCFPSLERLGVDGKKFIAEYWKTYPEGIGNSATNFFKFGLKHNEIFNQRLGRDKDYPTFKEFIQECLKTYISRFQHHHVK